MFQLFLYQIYYLNDCQLLAWIIDAQRAQKIGEEVLQEQRARESC